MADSKRIYTLFSRAGITDKDTQRDVIAGFTGGRTEHTSQMKPAEAANLVRYLETTARKSPEVRMRRKIIHLAHLIGWKDKAGKANTARIDNWCIKYGQFHKPLNDHSYKELVKLLTQFEQVFNSQIEKK